MSQVRGRARAVLATLVITATATATLPPVPAGAAATTAPRRVVALPWAVATSLVVEPGSGLVAVGGDSGVSIHGPAGDLLGTVPGVDRPTDLAVAGGFVYALDAAAAEVQRIDPVARRTTATWPLGSGTTFGGLGAAGGRLWTTGRPAGGAGSGRLWAVDPSTGAVTPSAATALAGADADVVGVPSSDRLVVTRSDGIELFALAGTSVEPVAAADRDGDVVVDVAVSPDESRLMALTSQGDVDEWGVSDLEPVPPTYPRTLTGVSLATAATGPEGGVVAVAAAGSGVAPDVAIYREGATTARVEATGGSPTHVLEVGLLALAPGGARLYGVRDDWGAPADLVVWDVGPTVAHVAPRVVASRGGGRVTVHGTGLSDVAVRVGAKATTSATGTTTARTVTVASLPTGAASVEASNPLGVSARSPLPVVVRDLGPFRDSAGFSDRQRRDFLGRAETAAEALAVDAALATGGSLGSLPADLARAPAWAGDRAPLIRLYQAVFLRPPDTAGLAYWQGEVRRGRSLTQVATAMAAAPEFRTRYGTLGDAAFVDRIYRNVLGRAADAAGRRYWLGVLAGGKPRGTVVLSFAQSPEYTTRMALQVDVTNLYLGMLRRAPTPAQLAASLATAAAASLQEVAVALAATIEYRDRVG